MIEDAGKDPIIVYCKRCGAKFHAPAGSTGLTHPCTHCGADIEIPEISETEPPELPDAPTDARAADSGTPTGQTRILIPIGTASPQKSKRVLPVVFGFGAVVFLLLAALYPVIRYFSAITDRNTNTKDQTAGAGAPESDAEDDNAIKRDMLAAEKRYAVVAASLADRMRRTHTLPTMPADISGTVPIKIISTRMSRKEEQIAGDSDQIRIWTLRLVIQNTGDDVLVFGDHCGLYESVGDPLTYAGVIQTRTGSSRDDQFEQWKNNALPRGTEKYRERYEVDNYQENNDLNAPVLMLLGKNVIYGTGSRCAMPSFGMITPGDRCVLFLTFHMSSVINDRFLKSVTFISPAMYPLYKSSGPAALLVLEFRPSKPSDLSANWKRVRNWQLSLDADTLSNRIADPRTPAFVRVEAINRLADIYGKVGLKSLNARLAAGMEPSIKVRAAALLAIGRLKDDQSFDTLRAILVDTKRSLGYRHRAALALGELGNTKALGFLAKTARDTPPLFNTALRAISEIGGEDATRTLLALLPSNPNKPAKKTKRTKAIFDAISECGADAVVPLAERINTPDDIFAEPAVVALGKIIRREKEHGLVPDTKRRALDALIFALKSPDDDMRQSAVDALGRTGLKAGMDLLIKELKESSTPRVFKALADSGQPEAQTALEAFLSDSVPERIRLFAALTLGKLGDKAATPVLEKIVLDAKENTDARKSALRALDKLKVASTEALLVKLAESPTDPLRWECLFRLADSPSEKADAAIRRSLAETDSFHAADRKRLAARRERAVARRFDSSLAARLSGNFPDERRDAALVIREKPDAADLPITILKQAMKTETDPAAFSAMASALIAVGDRDMTLVGPMLKKLESNQAAIRNEAGVVLRFLSNRTNGPYDGDTDAEAKEDIADWRAWAAARSPDDNL